MATTDSESQQVGGSSGRKWRAEARFECGLSAACDVKGVTYTVEIVDISRVGARLSIRSGLLPNVADGVVLKLLNGVSSKARVIWTQGTVVGLSFEEPLCDFWGGLHFDELGSDYYKAILQLQISGR